MCGISPRVWMDFCIKTTLLWPFCSCPALPGAHRCLGFGWQVTEGAGSSRWAGADGRWHSRGLVLPCQQWAALASCLLARSFVSWAGYRCALVRIFTLNPSPVRCLVIPGVFCADCKVQPTGEKTKAQPGLFEMKTSCLVFLFEKSPPPDFLGRLVDLGTCSPLPSGQSWAVRWDVQELLSVGTTRSGHVLYAHICF